MNNTLDTYLPLFQDVRISTLLHAIMLSSKVQKEKRTWSVTIVNNLQYRVYSDGVTTVVPTVDSYQAIEVMEHTSICDVLNKLFSMVILPIHSLLECIFDTYSGGATACTTEMRIAGRLTITQHRTRLDNYYYILTDYESMSREPIVVLQDGLTEDMLSTACEFINNFCDKMYRIENSYLGVNEVPHKVSTLRSNRLENIVRKELPAYVKSNIKPMVTKDTTVLFINDICYILSGSNDSLTVRDINPDDAETAVIRYRDSQLVVSLLLYLT